MDPAAVIGLAVTSCQVIQCIYNICEEFARAPKQLHDLCDELINIQNILGKISVTMRFEISTSRPSSYNDKSFQDAMQAAKVLLDDLLERLKKPRRGWFGSTKLRIAWVWQKSEVEEQRRKIESFRKFFALVPGGATLDAIQRAELEVLKLGDFVKQKKRASLRRCLADYDASVIHSQLVESHEPGTGSWFIDDGDLTRWLHQATIPSLGGNSNVLWLQGISGSGKSCLVAYAIEKMLERWSEFPERVVLYFHCSFQDNSSQTTSALLGCLISQLCDRRPELWEVAGEFYEERHASETNLESFFEQLSDEDRSDLLAKLLQSFQRVVIFLDAPNETPKPAALVDALLTATVKHHSVRLCISSTPDLNLRSMLSIGRSYLAVKMPNPGQTRDIKNYIYAQIEKAASFRTLDRQLKDEIVSTLIKKAEGSFRYVECHWSVLATKDCILQVKNTLNALPTSLSNHYRDILLGIPKESHEKTRRLLRWVTSQTRPLTIEELEEAIVINISPGDTFNVDIRIFEGKLQELLRLCGRLVQYDSETRTVSLAHSSVKEFLEDEKNQKNLQLGSVMPGDRHFRIWVSFTYTVAYLTQPHFTAGYLQNSSQQAARLREWPLLKYCAESLSFYWKETAKLGTPPESVAAGLKLLCQPSDDDTNGGFWGTYLQQVAPRYIPAVQPSSPLGSARLLTPMGYAAGMGWKFMINFMLDNGLSRDLDTRCSASNLPPLLRATAYGHELTAELLLSRGARVIDELNGTVSGWYWQNCSDNFKIIIAEAKKKQAAAGS